jgi:hypothetical protein
MHKQSRDFDYSKISLKSPSTLKVCLNLILAPKWFGLVTKRIQI